MKPSFRFEFPFSNGAFAAIRLGFALLLLVISFRASMAQSPPDASQASVPLSIAKWEKDIADLEKRDQEEVGVEDAVLFVGSSSIRRWGSLSEDMAPWRSLNRGYGGAKLTDLNYYADRLIGPHLGEQNSRRCRAVVVFVANDISGGESNTDPTSAEVVERFETLLGMVRSKDRTVPFFWIEVTPCEKRWHVWSEIEDATKGIRKRIDRDPHSHFIATAGAFLGSDGKPDARMFVADKLHLNQDGYQRWSHLIKAKLYEVLNQEPLETDKN